jgi:hypothetical protein
MSIFSIVPRNELGNLGEAPRIARVGLVNRAHPA